MSTTVRQAFGLRISCRPPIPGAPAPAESQQPLVWIEAGVVEERPDELHEPVWRTMIDGERVWVHRMADGALVMAFGRHGSFRISGDGTRVTCAPRPDAEPERWRRFLLDTVLWCTALLHGHVAMHAGAVVGRLGAVAIIAGTGGGKTSLTAELVRRGAALLSDDILVLTSDGAVIGHPAPHVMSLDAGSSSTVRWALGRPLATLDGQLWFEVARAAGAPTRLAAVILLERLEGLSAAAVELIDRPFLRLMAHTVAIPGLPVSHVRRRYDVLADLVETVPVWSLKAPAALPPTVLADLIEGAIAAQDGAIPGRLWDES
jgi:hypothetical protein